MADPVVTIARSLGAGGEDVGNKVAETLGFRHVDEEIIARAAEKSGATPERVEQAEQRQSLISRLLESMAATEVPVVYDSDIAADILQNRTESYQKFITEVIGETAAAGNVVIVAHGAAVPLAGRPDLLRVFITGSEQKRAQRLAAEGKLDERKALSAVRASDKSRADFLHRFYGLREETPTTYDLVINTDVLSVDQAVRLITAAVKG